MKMPNQVYWAFGSSTSLWVVYYNGSGTIAAALSSMPPSCLRQSGRVMPSQSKMTRIKTRARAPEGKRQVLIIMDLGGHQVGQGRGSGGRHQDVPCCGRGRAGLAKQKKARKSDSPRGIAAARRGGFEFVSCVLWEIR